MLIHAIAVAIHRFAAHHLPAATARRRFVEHTLVNIGIALSVLLAMLLIALLFSSDR